MISLIAAVAAATSWTMFAEGAVLGATVYAVGRGISKR